ncbi:MAG: hypothetical protein GTO63_31895 [Anaerolineae bacterium]|nr:hypothetical protein [Anaerolineae bacterium]NIN99280.1 hypothetical protein [Anaerolineae bacterium]NIQ82118.1 hypothetical protein [Anaerolineae bacterium]
MDLGLLKRSEEYFLALEGRLGFPVLDGGSELVHLSGVSFEGRQDTLAAVKVHCGFDRSPPIKLEVETNPKILQYDSDAVQVLVAVDRDDLTGDWFNWHQAGYLPRRRCPQCARTYPGEKGKTIQVCSDCSFPMALGTPAYELSVFNARVKGALAAGQEVRVGLDNVTEMQGARAGANMGCDIWVRIE